MKKIINSIYGMKAEKENYERAEILLFCELIDWDNIEYRDTDSVLDGRVYNGKN